MNLSEFASDFGINEENLNQQLNEFLQLYRRFAALTTKLPTQRQTLHSFTTSDDDVNFEFWINGVGYFFIGIFGVLGNIASMNVLSHRQMRSPVNLMLIALAMSDLVLIVTAFLLFGLKSVYPFNGQLKTYYFNVQPIIAPSAYSLVMIAQTISTYLTLPISLERYIAICMPLKAKSLCTRANTKLSICIVTLFSILYNVPKFFELNLNEETDDEYGRFYYISHSSLRRDKLYLHIYIHWMYCIFMYVIPLSGISFFNLMIYRQVNIMNRQRSKLISQQIQEIKLTPMLFCVVAVFLGCNILAVLVNIQETFFGITNRRLAIVANFFVILNSSVNFIIYVVLVKKFRKILITKFTSVTRKSSRETRS